MIFPAINLDESRSDTDESRCGRSWEHPHGSLVPIDGKATAKFVEVRDKKHAEKWGELYTLW